MSKVPRLLRVKVSQDGPVSESGFFRLGAESAGPLMSLVYNFQDCSDNTIVYSLSMISSTGASMKGKDFGNSSTGMHHGKTKITSPVLTPVS